MNRVTLPRVAFWLVPERRARVHITALIHALAERFTAPQFLPHLTLYSCERTAGQAELARMAGLTAHCRALRLQVHNTATCPRLSQTLYWGLRGTPELVRLHRALHGTVPRPSGYQLKPHLSLLYQDLPEPVRVTLTHEYASTLPDIRFDELRAVAIPERLSDLADFNGWQTLLVARLRD